MQIDNVYISIRVFQNMTNIWNTIVVVWELLHDCIQLKIIEPIHVHVHVGCYMLISKLIN